MASEHSVHSLDMSQHMSVNMHAQQSSRERGIHIGIRLYLHPFVYVPAIKALMSLCRHWRSSHYAVKHMRNKNSNIQGRSPNEV